MTVPDTGSTPLRKVSKMDYEVAVIGSGSAGKEAALLAAKEGHRVAVIEKETLGGTCYHRGCFAIRDWTAEVVKLCSMMLRLNTRPEQLNRCRFIHPSPAEALRRCVGS